MDFSEAYSALDKLNESKRVISDSDVLYHYTNPTPFYNIFTDDRLRGDIKTDGVCFTTDRDYVIYNYPCGIQFSREKLLEDGYELNPIDEWEEDHESRGESEERIYGDVENVSKYVTKVYINWQGREGAEIPIVYSGDDYMIADAKYDNIGNEDESYDLNLTTFRFLLASLKAKGIQVIERGRPDYNKYYLDSSNHLHRREYPDSGINIG